jgi:uncharacterized membrane protein (DUF2068 family)
MEVEMHRVFNSLKSPTLARTVSFFIGLASLGYLMIWLRMLGLIPASFNPHDRFAIARAHFLSLQSLSYQAAFIAFAVLQFVGAVFLWKRKSPATLFFVASFGCYGYEMFAYRDIAPVNSTHIFFNLLSNVIYGVLLCTYVGWITSKRNQVESI